MKVELYYQLLSEHQYIRQLSDKLPVKSLRTPLTLSFYWFDIEFHLLNVFINWKN